MAIISVHNLHVTLNRHHILDGLSFDIEKGDIAAIIGPNGSGKTTLLKTILGLVPYQGEIQILGKLPRELAEIASNIGYVPQRLEFDRSMPITVEELLRIHFSAGNFLPKDTLALIGVDTLLHRLLGALSGGEFQRVLLSLALLNDPEILFLDEPVASIDIEGAAEIYTLLETLTKEKGITVLLVSHDVDIVYRYANKVLCVNHQLLCKGAPHEALTKEVIERLYGGNQALYVHKEKRYV